MRRELDRSGPATCVPMLQGRAHATRDRSKLRSVGSRRERTARCQRSELDRRRSVRRRRGWEHFRKLADARSVDFRHRSLADVRHNVNGRGGGSSYESHVAAQSRSEELPLVRSGGVLPLLGVWAATMIGACRRESSWSPSSISLNQARRSTAMHFLLRPVTTFGRRHRSSVTRRRSGTSISLTATRIAPT